MKRSLRQLLLISLLSASMLIWSVTAFINYNITRNEVAALFDAELAQSGKVLLAFLDSLPQDNTLEQRLKLTQINHNADQDVDRKIEFQLKSEDAGIKQLANDGLLFPELGINNLKEKKKSMEYL